MFGLHYCDPTPSGKSSNPDRGVVSSKLAPSRSFREDPTFIRRNTLRTQYSLYLNNPFGVFSQTPNYVPPMPDVDSCLSSGTLFSGGHAGELLEGILVCFNDDGTRCSISCASMVRACLVPDSAVKSIIMKGDKLDSETLFNGIDLSHLSKRSLSSTSGVTHFSIISGPIEPNENPSKKFGSEGAHGYLNHEPGGIQDDISMRITPVTVSDLGPGKVGLSAKVESAGDYKLFVQLLGIDIGGTPAPCSIQAGPPDAPRCKLSGKAMSNAEVSVLPPARRVCRIVDEDAIVYGNLSLTAEEKKRLKMNSIVLTLYDQYGNRCYDSTYPLDKFIPKMRLKGIGGVFYGGAKSLGEGQFNLDFAVIRRQHNSAMLKEETDDIMHLSETHKIFVTIAGCQVNASPFSPKLLPHDLSNPTGDLLKESRISRVKHPHGHVIVNENPESIEAALHAQTLQDAEQFSASFGHKAAAVGLGPSAPASSWTSVKDAAPYHESSLPLAHKMAVKKADEASDLRKRLLDVSRPIEKSVSAFRSAQIEFHSTQTKAENVAKERARVKQDMDTVAKCLIQKGMNNLEISEAMKLKGMSEIPTSRLFYFQDRALKSKAKKSDGFVKTRNPVLEKQLDPTATIFNMLDPISGKIVSKKINQNELAEIMNDISDLTTRELLKSQYSAIDDITANWCQPIRVVQSQRKQYKVLKNIQGELQEMLVRLLAEEKDLEEEDKNLSGEGLNLKLENSKDNLIDSVSLQEQKDILLNQDEQLKFFSMMFGLEHTSETTEGGFNIPEILKNGILKDSNGKQIILNAKNPMDKLSLSELRQAIDFITSSSTKDLKKIMASEGISASVQTDGGISRDATVARLLAAQRLLSNHQILTRDDAAEAGGQVKQWWEIQDNAIGSDIDNNDPTSRSEAGNSEEVTTQAKGQSIPENIPLFGHEIADEIVHRIAKGNNNLNHRKDNNNNNKNSPGYATATKFFTRLDRPGQVIGQLEDVLEWLKARPRLKIALLELFYYYETLSPAFQHLSSNGKSENLKQALLEKTHFSKKGVVVNGLFEDTAVGKGLSSRSNARGGGGGGKRFAGGAMGMGAGAVALFLRDLNLNDSTRMTAFSVLFERHMTLGLPANRETLNEITADLENEIIQGFLEDSKVRSQDEDKLRDDEKVKKLIEEAKWNLLRDMENTKRLLTTQFVPFIFSLAVEHESTTMKNVRQQIVHLHNERMNLLAKLRKEHPGAGDETLVNGLPQLPPEIMQLRSEDMIRPITSVEAFEWFVEDNVMPLYRALLAARASAQIMQAKPTGKPH